MTGKYALLTVSERNGIEDFARGLYSHGYSLVASDGTARFLHERSIPATTVEEYINHRPVMQPQGIKLIHPKVFGGILADLKVQQHILDLDEFGIYPFDIVACNFYPFAREPKIMNIDIGGPAMVRCAAKNHERVTVVTDHTDYPIVLDEIDRFGDTTKETRLRLARKAFQESINHDRLILDFLEKMV